MTYAILGLWAVTWMGTLLAQSTTGPGADLDWANLINTVGFPIAVVLLIIWGKLDPAGRRERAEKLADLAQARETALRDRIDDRVLPLMERSTGIVQRVETDVVPLMARALVLIERLERRLDHGGG